jgi:hypothetical protein
MLVEKGGMCTGGTAFELVSYAKVRGSELWTGRRIEAGTE